MSNSEPATHCSQCGGPFARPGEHDCPDQRHPTPDLAQTIVAIVERELSDDWPGVSWDDLDEMTLFELRDDLAGKVRAELSKEGVKPLEDRP